MRFSAAIEYLLISIKLLNLTSFIYSKRIHGLLAPEIIKLGEKKGESVPGANEQNERKMRKGYKSF